MNLDAKVAIPLPDEGITVQGSIVNQQFRYGSIGELEETPNVIIIKLRGTTSVGIPVERPVEVKTRVECPSCGRRSKSGAKFCSRCGTGLV
jgi:ribosomal protein L37E